MPGRPRRGSRPAPSISHEGRAFFQPARAVVLTAHTYENTRLLLLSRSKAFPDGLANNAGQVGRNAMSHLFIGMDGLFPGRKLNRFGGTWPQCTSIDDLNADNFDHTGLGFVGGGIINAVPEAKPIGTALSTPPSVPRWGSAWKDWLAANGNSVGRLVATVESLPYEDSFLDLDPAVCDRIGMPVIRQTYRLHEQEDRRYDHLAAAMKELLLEAGAAETWLARPKLPAAPFQSVFGATRMGTDPAASVVDPFCCGPRGAEPGDRRRLELPDLRRLPADRHDPGPRLAGRRPARGIAALNARYSRDVSRAQIGSGG